MTTPILGITELTSNQAQPEVTVNTAFRDLEALQYRALSRTTAAQPSSPAEGDVYILPASPTGADWGSLAVNDVARYTGGAWKSLAAFEGISLWVNDENIVVSFDGSAWVTVGSVRYTTGSGFVLSGATGTARIDPANGIYIFDSLPTADPTVAGQVWNDSGTMKISAG